MRSLIRFTTLPSILICGLAGCASSGDTQDELAGSSTDETVLDGQLAARSSATYYFEIAQDLRKCAAPVCGGWFLDRLNLSTTQCHDGQWAAECYTPVLDWSSSHLSVTDRTRMLDACYQYASAAGVHVIVRGQFARTNSTTPRPDLGRFIVTEAWLGENDAVSSGTFVRVKDNGLRCFAAPCPSLTETPINASPATNIAALDFTPAGMTDEQITACTQETFTSDGVLVAGDRYTFQVNGTTANGRTVTAGYYRLGN